MSNFIKFANGVSKNKVREAIQRKYKDASVYQKAERVKIVVPILDRPLAEISQAVDYSIAQAARN
jgi:hypothetical protein